MIVMLIIKLRKKLLICIPPIAFVLSFVICFAVFFAATPTKINYSRDKKFITVDKCGSMAVCDISDGSSASRSSLKEAISPYAVEIDHYVVTEATEKHSDSLEDMLSYIYVRNLYLPLTTDKKELSYVSQIYEVAKQYDINVVFYSSGERRITHHGVTLVPCFDESSAWIDIETEK